MPFLNALIHTCSIQSYTVGQGSAGEITRTPATLQTEIRCRLVQRAQNEPMTDVGQMVQTDATLFLQSEESISTEDEILNVVFRVDGSTFDAGPYEVVQVVKRDRNTVHHISARLKKIE